jgi:ABC-type transporter Mla subunit MlaD
MPSSASDLAGRVTIAGGADFERSTPVDSPAQLLWGVATAAPRAALRTAVRLAQFSRETLRAAEQMPTLVGRAAALLSAAESLVARIGAVTEHAEAVVRYAEKTSADAGAVVEQVSDLERRVAGLLAAAQPLISALTRVGPSASADAATLLHRSIPLMDQIESMIMPLLGEMRAAVPDVREILPIVQRLEPVLVDVETRIAGLPGAAHLRKRGAKEVAAPGESEETEAFDTKP